MSESFVRLGWFVSLSRNRSMASSYSAAASSTSPSRSASFASAFTRRNGANESTSSSPNVGGGRVSREEARKEASFAATPLVFVAFFSSLSPVAGEAR